jgi:hypothetical protein
MCSLVGKEEDTGRFMPIVVSSIMVAGDVNRGAQVYGENEEDCLATSRRYNSVTGLGGADNAASLLWAGDE